MAEEKAAGDVENGKVIVAQYEGLLFGGGLEVKRKYMSLFLFSISLGNLDNSVPRSAVPMRNPGPRSSTTLEVWGG